MEFAERQNLRKQAVIELELGNYGEYERLMQLSKQNRTEELVKNKLKDKTLKYLDYGSNHPEIIKRRRLVKVLLESGYEPKYISLKCEIKESNIRKDIQTLKELGLIN